MTENQQKMEEETWKMGRNIGANRFLCFWVPHSRWKAQVGALEGLNLTYALSAPGKGSPLQVEKRTLPPTNTAMCPKLPLN